MYDELIKRLRSVKDSWQAEEESWMLQAADAIEELICDLADEHNARLDAEERHRWIPATEWLPGKEDTVIFHYAWTGRSGTVYKDFTIATLAEIEYQGSKPLAWMPLPELPEEECDHA